LLKFSDTHCHLFFDEFRNDINQVISRASNEGITRILVPGIDLKTSLAAIELSHKFDQVYASVGIHPNEAETWTNKSCEDIRVLCKSEKVVAVGEIGLDFYRSPGTSLLQEKILKDQLTIAQELQLPVLLHNRESSEN